MKFNNLMFTLLILYVIIGALWTTQARATPSSEAYEQCAQVGQLTAFVIQLRDAGVPYKTARNIIPSVAHGVVKAVYRNPEADIQSFPSKVALECIKLQWGTV